MLSSGYRTSDSQSSDSDGSNSDDDVAWQRKPTRFTNKSNIPSDENIVTTTNGFSLKEKKRKVNNVWTTVLQEQSLSDVFGGFNMERPLKYGRDRTCESYDYTRKRLDTRPDVPCIESEFAAETTDCNEVFGVDTDKPNGCATKKKEISVVNKKRWKPSPEEMKTARLIIRKLSEKKRDLVYSVVKVLGISKSMDLLSMTENVEDNGGMMILNGTRRRTPGGVFFQLIKSDNNITKAQYDEIFSENKQINKMSNKKKKKVPKPEVASMDIDEKLPEIPNATDIFLSNFSENVDSKVSEADAIETEEGEICD